MGILTRLFGQSGKVRFEGITITGENLSGTLTVESFNNNKEEMEEKIKEIVYVETGIRMNTLQIKGFAEK